MLAAVLNRQGESARLLHLVCTWNVAVPRAPVMTFQVLGSGVPTHCQPGEPGSRFQRLSGGAFNVSFSLAAQSRSELEEWAKESFVVPRTKHQLQAPLRSCPLFLSTRQHQPGNATIFNREV
jgi:hypothetical protein